MKSKISIFCLLIFAALWSNGCTNQSEVSVPLSSDILSIKFSSHGEIGLAELTVQKDSVRYYYFNSFTLTAFDTVIIDPRQLDSLKSSFNLQSFWQLNDKVDQRAIGADAHLESITITTASNDISITTPQTDNYTKTIKYTYPPQEQITSLYDRIYRLIYLMKKK